MELRNKHGHVWIRHPKIRDGLECEATLEELRVLSLSESLEYGRFVERLLEDNFRETEKPSYADS